jgi:hypothetical protein
MYKHGVTRKAAIQGASFSPLLAGSYTRADGYEKLMGPRTHPSSGWWMGGSEGPFWGDPQVPPEPARVVPHQSHLKSQTVRRGFSEFWGTSKSSARGVHKARDPARLLTGAFAGLGYPRTCRLTSSGRSLAHYPRNKTNRLSVTSRSTVAAFRWSRARPSCPPH